jgi:hypothetical protein
MFEGMSKDLITAMLLAQGLTCTFIDEATYMANITPPGGS